MIDIIIPVYNAKDTIERTLSSIALQDNVRQLNVYIVDDCSDYTYNHVYEKYKKKMKLHLYRLSENSGPGVARQYGFDHSYSPYVMFIDSDDTFYDCYAIECLYQFAKEGKYDISIANMIEVTDRFIDYYRADFDVLHSKLYRRSFLKKNDIYFPDFYNSEDLAFNYSCLLYNPKIGYCDLNIVYVYVKHQNSLTTTDDYFSDKHIKCYVNSLNWVINYGNEHHVDSVSIAKMVCYSFLYLYFYFVEDLEDKNMSYVFEYYSVFEKYYPLVPEKVFNDYLSLWVSRMNDSKYLISFYDFIVYCQRKGEVVAC